MQKLSAEAYKEQMAGSGKTLTALGSYWKGRKPLILNKACILGCLLPATDDLSARPRDLREADGHGRRIVRRPLEAPPQARRRSSPRSPSPASPTTSPSNRPASCPTSAPVDWSKPEYDDVKVAWRDDLPELERRRLEAQMLPKAPYRERVDEAKRPEEVMDTVHDHIWDAVNAHLGTSAHSFPELVEQLGIMRFGHRPRVADTFCGSGQIPFEAARLGCDVYASTSTRWPACSRGARSTSSAAPRESREELATAAAGAGRRGAGGDRPARRRDRRQGLARQGVSLLRRSSLPADRLDGAAACRLVIVSKGYRVIAELVPDPANKRYDIRDPLWRQRERTARRETGTVRSRRAWAGPVSDPHS